MFADPKERITRRLRQLIWLAASRCRRRTPPCATGSAGASRAALRRRSGGNGMARGRNTAPRHLGADEIHRGKAQKFYKIEAAKRP